MVFRSLSLDASAVSFSCFGSTYVHRNTLAFKVDGPEAKSKRPDRPELKYARDLAVLLKSSNVLRRELERSQKTVFEELQQDIVDFEAVDGVVQDAATEHDEGGELLFLCDKTSCRRNPFSCRRAND